jgi:hypothetical protein
MPLSRLLSRAWFYFRTGYGTYLVFLLGAANTLTVVYYLLIRNIPQLQDYFPHFTTFAIIAVITGVPVTVLIGWLHLKRSPIYTSELDVGVEANPYYYKMPPGYWPEVIIPTYQETIRYLTRLLEKEKLLTAEDRERIKALDEKMNTLIKGGYVGQPKRKINF